MDKIISEALELVSSGVLRVETDGIVTRLKRMPAGNGTDRQWYPCNPRQAGFINKAGRGYRCFDWITKTGKNRHIRLHRLVYVYFYGDIPNGYEIHHKDNNKLNNHPDNLALVTHQQNMRMAADDGLYQSVIGSNNPCAKVNESTIEKICQLLSEDKTARAIAKQLGISVHIIYNLVHGKTWQHLDCVRNIKYL